MRVFLDTSVLISAVVQQHENHDRSFAALERVQNDRDEGFISGHSLAEMYTVLTRAPQPFKHSPEQAYLSIEENVVKHFKISVLSGTEYASLVKEAALAGVVGGTVYDAVILKCAIKSGAEKIYTLNARHFHNIAPKIIGPVIVPP